MPHGWRDFFVEKGNEIPNGMQLVEFDVVVERKANATKSDKTKYQGRTIRSFQIRGEYNTYSVMHTNALDDFLLLRTITDPTIAGSSDPIENRRKVNIILTGKWQIDRITWRNSNKGCSTILLSARKEVEWEAQDPPNELPYPNVKDDAK